MKPFLSRPSSPLAVAAVLLVVAAGCGTGSDGGSPSPTSAPQPAPGGSAGNSAGAADTVNVQNFAFTPTALTVAPGATVTWKFDDSTDHTVVADDNSFATQQPMGNGQTFTHTFETAGSLGYHCSIHPFMKATVTVK